MSLDYYEAGGVIVQGALQPESPVSFRQAIPQHSDRATSGE
jgi:hypothetical protein